MCCLFLTDGSRAPKEEPVKMIICTFSVLARDTCAKTKSVPNYSHDPHQQQYNTMKSTIPSDAALSCVSFLCSFIVKFTITLWKPRFATSTNWTAGRSNCGKFLWYLIFFQSIKKIELCSPVDSDCAVLWTLLRPSPRICVWVRYYLFSMWRLEILDLPNGDIFVKYACSREIGIEIHFRHIINIRFTSTTSWVQYFYGTLQVTGAFRGFFHGSLWAFNLLSNIPLEKHEKHIMIL